MSKTNKNETEYDYIIYVDASGDDGLKFEKGSSLCFVASSVIIHKDDISHNIAILNEIKKLMGGKVTDEVKYSKVRRHYNSEKIHNLLKDIKASLYSSIVFKQLTKIPMYLDPSTKALGAFTHAYVGIIMGTHFAEESDVKVKIVMDHMKATEESIVKNLISDETFRLANMTPPIHTVEYRDSKAKDYELIQLADIVAGLTRTYFENHNDDKDLKYFWFTCPICNTTKKLCRKRKKPKSDNHPFLNLLPMYMSNPRGHILDSLRFEPSEIWRRIKYLYCTKK